MGFVDNRDGHPALVELQEIEELAGSESLVLDCATGEVREESAETLSSFQRYGHVAEEEWVEQDGPNEFLALIESGEGIDPQTSIQFYLSEIGRYPLLSYEEEVAIGQRIEASRLGYLDTVLSSRFVQVQALKLMQELGSGDLNITTRCNVGVSQTQKQQMLRNIAACNAKSLQTIIDKNDATYATLKSADLSNEERAELWHSMYKHSFRAAKLIQEVDFRHCVIEEMFEPARAILREPPGSYDHDESPPDGVYLEDGFSETVAQLSHRVDMADAHRKNHETAANELAQHNLRLVVWRARAYRDRGLTLMELILAGNEGLHQAATQFEWNRGNKFITYATWWVDQRMKDEIRNLCRTIHVSKDKIDQFSYIRGQQEAFRIQHDRLPTTEELAAFTRMTTRMIAELSREMRNTQFFEDLGKPDIEGSFESIIPDEETGSSAVNAKVHILQAGMADLLPAILDPNEEQIMRNRFEFDGPRQPRSVIENRLGITHRQYLILRKSAGRKLLDSSDAQQLYEFGASDDSCLELEPLMRVSA